MTIIAKLVTHPHFPLALSKSHSIIYGEDFCVMILSNFCIYRTVLLGMCTVNLVYTFEENLNFSYLTPLRDVTTRGI